MLLEIAPAWRPVKLVSTISIPLYLATAGGPLTKDFHPDRFHRRALLLDGHGLLVGQGLAQPLLAREVELDSRLEFVDEKRARSKTLGDIHHLLVEALEDGGHADDRHGADQHAQDGQESAKLVGPQRIQGEQQVFTNVVAALVRHAQFSVRKASMGSSLAAWLAG